MPNYDYVCEACGEESDIVHGMDEKVRKCPKCGKLKLRRSWRKVAAYHSHVSPMHPRVNRGKGNTGTRRKDLPSV
jgi:putative FmdB family regulatory protein